MSKMKPSYSIWEALATAIALGTRALEEIRMLARLPGPPGEPGLGFDDMSVEYDGERTFSFVLQRGAVKKKFDFTVPLLIYRKTYSPDIEYQKGDVVTYGGSMFIAVEDTKSKPEMDGTWKLAVKHGRDAHPRAKIGS